MFIIDKVLIHVGRYIGGIIAQRLQSHKVIFDTLLPVAEQRCRERDLVNLGQATPKHVRCNFSHSYLFNLDRVADPYLQGRLHTMDYGHLTKTNPLVSQTSSP